MTWFLISSFYFRPSAKTPFIKLSENMSSDYPYFSLYEDEGISDLYDITLPPSTTTLIADEEEEVYDEEDIIESDEDMDASL